MKTTNERKGGWIFSLNISRKGQRVLLVICVYGKRSQWKGPLQEKRNG